MNIKNIVIFIINIIILIIINIIHLIINKFIENIINVEKQKTNLICSVKLRININIIIIVIIISNFLKKVILPSKKNHNFFWKKI
jgi:hypothetical protein